MMGWYQDDWSGAAVFGMIMMAALWAGLVVLAVWAIARLTRSDRPRAQEAEAPRAILDRRFASGEIDAESYAKARRILEGAMTPSAAQTGR
ncbi:MAG: hypothetical protein PSX37_01600 [bacterium]|nr:hypothetical protein [bacterium]